MAIVRMGNVRLGRKTSLKQKETNVKNLLKWLLTITTALAFYTVLAYLMADALAVIIIVSILLHEMGHMTVLRYYGYRSNVYLIPPLGGVAVIEDKDAYKKMRRFELALVALAGPAVNFALIIIGLSISLKWRREGLTLSSVNAGLTMFNLLPFAILDGGRYVRALFESTDEKTDKEIATLVSGIAVLFGVVLAIVGDFTYYAPLIFIGIHHAVERDNPEASHEKRSMTHQQAWRTLKVYMCLLFGGMVAYLILPPWTEWYTWK